MMTSIFFACCFFLQSLTPEVIEHAQAGAAARQQGQVGLAIQEFRKVTELAPGSAVGHADLGDAYFQNGEYSAAIVELELALKLNSDLVGAHQTLGIALLMQGNPEGALPHLEKTATPELLGLAYLETGRFGVAIAALQAALGKQPDDPNLLYYFGRATGLASKRSFDQLAKLHPGLARKSGSAADDVIQPQDLIKLQDALAKQPEDADLLSAFGREALVASKQAFDQILQTNPDSARAHQVRAERYVESGRLPDAEREYVESLRLKPFTSNVHLGLGDVLAAEGNRAGAVAQYRIETQLRPLSADAFYSLGAALLLQGRASGAVEELVKADRLRPNTPKILLALGGAALDVRDLSRAEASWTALLSIDKESMLAAKAHLGLSTLYRRAGRAQDADRENAIYEQLKIEQSKIEQLKTQGGH
jgi:tetratricopeptide (TPR) repeat protein